MKKLVAFLMVLALIATGSLAIAAETDTSREFNETHCSCC